MCMWVSTTSVTDARSMPAASSRWTNRPARGKFKPGSTPIPASMSKVRPPRRTTTALSAHSRLSGGRNLSSSHADRAAGLALWPNVAPGSDSTPSLTTITSISPTNTTHSYTADRVAKSCLPSRHSNVDWLLVDKLTDTALAAGEGDTCMPLFKMVKGLSMLRLGNFEKAIEWAEKSLNSPFVHAKAQAYAILAMAHWHLGHKDEARAMLAKGNTLAPRLISEDAAARSGEKWMQFHETPYHARLLARIQLA